MPALASWIPGDLMQLLENSAVAINQIMHLKFLIPLGSNAIGPVAKQDAVSSPLPSRWTNQQLLLPNRSPAEDFMERSVTIDRLPLLSNTKISGLLNRGHQPTEHLPSPPYAK